MPEVKPKVLILDDELLIVRSLANLLESTCDVFMAGDAEAALELAREHDLAVILCDERMPGVSGHEFLRRAREISQAVCIMMSGFADMSALTEAVNSGRIFAYIAKPWDPLKLRLQIAAAVVHFNLTAEVEHERGLLRALMENIPDLIYFKDLQSRFIRVNEAHARNLGAKDSADCIGKSNENYFGPEETIPWRLHEEEIIRSGQPQADRVQEVQNHEGTVSWWSTTKVPMFDRSGKVSGIAGVSRNITELKSTDKILRDQYEHTRMILESATDAFIGMEADGAIIAWNPQAERTFGWSAAEITGLLLCDTVIPHAYRAAHANGVEQFIEMTHGNLSGRPIEFVALHRDGHEFPVEARVWPVRRDGVLSFNAFVRDITEQRGLEEARRKETTLIELLQSVTVAANQASTLEPIAQACLDRICSPAVWQTGHVYLLSKKPPFEMISTALWHEAGTARFAAFREASRCGADLRIKGLPGCVLTSGEPRWLVNLADEEPLSARTRAAVEAGLKSGFGFPVVVEEKVVAVFEFFSLRTQPPDREFLTMMGHIGTQLAQVIIRQRVEEDLRTAKSAAEFANRAKSDFLTTMSHEMRTPMNAILGMSDLLSESLLGEKERGYVRIFQKAGHSLLDLINDLLDFSKVESGHVKLESIAFDLKDLLGRIIEMMEPRARDRGLALTLELLPGVPRHLAGDPNRLRQILTNLLGNALKFTERGSITLRAGPDAGGVPGCLRFDVADTGIGIAADKTKMIFERFTQADSSTTRKYGGTGLGLAISKGLVELMGGQMGCESEPGRGSTFFFNVRFEIRPEPVAAMPVEPGAAVPQWRPAGNQRAFRILIAEDSEHNLLLIQAYLEDPRFQVEVAENGLIALEKVKSGGVDLVLMDIQMPVMDGLEATRAIRQWESLTHASPVPIIALTAQAGAESQEKSLEAGCTGHLTKPVRKAALLDAMGQYLGGTILVTPPKGIEPLVPKYLFTIRREMSEMLAGLDSKNCEISRRIGHQFKGSGAGYGFPEIARVGAAVELAAMASNGEEIRSQLLALTRYLDRVEIAQ